MSIILDNKGICQALSKIIGWWVFGLVFLVFVRRRRHLSKRGEVEQ